MKFVTNSLLLIHFTTVAMGLLSQGHTVTVIHDVTTIVTL